MQPFSLLKITGAGGAPISIATLWLTCFGIWNRVLKSRSGFYRGKGGLPPEIASLGQQRAKLFRYVTEPTH
jgi:hypothetical protein